jgi:hypothetical protein
MNENADPRKHQLLTKEIIAKMPPFFSGEDTPLAEKEIVVKYFSPYTGWRWYVLEGEYNRVTGDWRFFAWVEGQENELGYVLLSELEEAIIWFGSNRVPAVERDLYFDDGQKLGEVASL